MSAPQKIRQDPDVLKLLSRLPTETANSLTNIQLQHLKLAIGSGQYRKHKIDIRGTFPVPFYPSRIYFVVLMGRNVRHLTRQEQAIAFSHIVIMFMMFLILSLSLGLIFLYLIKSAVGIDIFENGSLGLWTWLKSFTT